MADSALTTYMGGEQATALLQELQGAGCFCAEQLVELFGQSVAACVLREYRPDQFKRLCVLAGPGNSGAYGLVAARHLSQLGYDVQVCCPAPPDERLAAQCKSLDIKFVPWADLLDTGLSKAFDLVVDAVVGLMVEVEGSHPTSLFPGVLQALLPDKQPPTIVSVDLPCGWDVSAGASGLEPDMLVSVMVPLLGAKAFKGRHHYLYCCTIPPAIRVKYGLQLPLPPRQQMDLCVKLSSSSTPAQDLKVADMRISYERGGLEDEDLEGADPMAVWDSWLKQAVDGKVCEEPNIILLATADELGQPSVRAMLLKGYNKQGFIFFTNYNSRKGSDLEANRHAAFAVYWEKLQRQVRVEGVVERISEEESTQYFHSRPKGSQIGAWVSSQSQPLRGGRKELEERAEELQKLYADPSAAVPKPPHWGGYLVRPTSIEFWQGRPSRLHDRIQFKRPRGDSAWEMRRLQP